MFVDARSLPEGHVHETEVCVIGAGAAGISLARVFSARSFRVTLLESGGLERDEETQALYAGESVGLPYFPLQVARLRYFGGTTNHWGGVCRPFEASDFEERPWIDNSGWPIQLSDLDPYYRRAAEFCRLDSFEWNEGYWEQRSPHPPLALAGGRVRSRIVQQAPEDQRNFGQTYRSQVERAKNVTTLLNANLQELETDESGRVVTGAQVATLTGVRFRVRARFFVLAAGGIENARLLLLSDGHHPAGLGNGRDQVGRFFMEHPRFMAGTIRPARPDLPLRFYAKHEIGHAFVRSHLVLSEEARREEGLVDVQVRLEPVYESRYRRAVDSKAANSLVYLMSALGRAEAPGDFGTHVGNVVSDLDDVALASWQRLRYDDVPIREVQLFPRIDATPNPDSRVTLAEATDALGRRRVRLDWRLHPNDKRSVRRSLEVLGAELGNAGLGRLQIACGDDDESWPPDTAGGWHHMGMTRMSADPAHGVVDRDCRVHGVSNLYVAGSSVFVTAGSGTPTITIVALALRLADHLVTRLS